MDPRTTIGTPFGPFGVPPPLDDGPPQRRPEPPAPVVVTRVGGRQLAWLVVVVALVAAMATGAVARVTGWGDRTVVERVVTNSSPIGDRPSDIQAILARVLPSVVSVSAVTSPATSPSWDIGSDVSSFTTRGTGIAVGTDGEIITNNHVVAGASSITVATNGSIERHAATVIGADAGEDLAPLRVPGLHNLPAATWGDSSKVAVGDEVITIGYALGLSGGPTVTDGIVSGTGRRVNTQTESGDITLDDMLQTDAAISSGNSGGPLVNGDSQVIGINTVIATSTQETSANNIGFAITAAKVLRELPLLRAGATNGSLDSLNRVSVPACSRTPTGVSFLLTGGSCIWRGRVS